MREHEKSKATPQKEISSTSPSVLTRSNNGAHQSSAVCGEDNVPEAPQKPPVTTSQGSPAAELQPSTSSAPEAISAKQSRGDTTARTASAGPRRHVKGKLFVTKTGTSSTRQKAMALSVPVLVITLSVVFIRVFKGPSRGTASERQSEPANAIADLGNRIDWQIPAPYPKTLRDPMQLNSLATAKAKIEIPETGKPEIRRLIVKGVLYSEDNPAAVIGTQIVHEGDKISGATVVRINRDGVVLEMNGKRWTQKVQQ